jgi:hypothetical protein
LIQNATAIEIQSQRQLPLPVRQRNQLPLGIQMDRPLFGGQNRPATGQPRSQQQKHNPAAELIPSRGFSFARPRHPSLAANTPRRKMVFRAVHIFVIHGFKHSVGFFMLAFE